MVFPHNWRVFHLLSPRVGTVDTKYFIILFSSQALTYNTVNAPNESPNMEYTLVSKQFHCLNNNIKSDASHRGIKASLNMNNTDIKWFYILIKYTNPAHSWYVNRLPSLLLQGDRFCCGGQQLPSSYHSPSILYHLFPQHLTLVDDFLKEQNIMVGYVTGDAASLTLMVIYYK